MSGERPKEAGKSYDRQMSGDERAAEQRDRIVAAATELFSEHGFHETRIEDIVARAVVSKRTLYSHFRDLEALRFAVFERALGATLVRLGEIGQDPSLDDPLRAALTALFDQVANQTNLARIVTYEFSLGEPRSLAMRNQVTALFVGLLMHGTARDHAAGTTPNAPDELTMRAMVGMFHGLATHFLDTDPSRAPTGVDVALRIYRSVYPWEPRPAAT